MSRRKQETPKHFNNDQSRHTGNNATSGVDSRVVQNGSPSNSLPPLDPPNYVEASEHEGNGAVGGMALPPPAFGGYTQDRRNSSLGRVPPPINSREIGAMIDRLVWEENIGLPQQRSYVPQGNNAEDFQYYRADLKRRFEIVLRNVSESSQIPFDEKQIGNITDYIDQEVVLLFELLNN